MVDRGPTSAICAEQIDQNQEGRANSGRRTRPTHTKASHANIGHRCRPDVARNSPGRPKVYMCTEFGQSLPYFDLHRETCPKLARLCPKSTTVDWTRPDVSQMWPVPIQKKMDLHPQNPRGHLRRPNRPDPPLVSTAVAPSTNMTGASMPIRAHPASSASTTSVHA